MTSQSINQPEPGRSLLRNRNFILLWSAYAVSALGDHLSEMAILKTQDALNVDVDITPLNARMTFMFFLPFLPLAPLTGMLADRFPRVALMISADLFRCLILFFFASLIAFAQPLGSWGPFLPLVLVGAFAALFSPARSALLPTLIRQDQVIRANGLISGLGIIATMAAALIGGYLADRHHVETAFRLNAGTFLLSALLVLGIRMPRAALAAGSTAPPGTNGKGDAPRPATLSQLRDGFHYARCHRHVRELLLIAALIWFCGALVHSVIPAVVRDVYHGTFTQISTYRALLGLGFIIGATIIALLGNALRSEIAINWGLTGVGVAIALFASSLVLPVTSESRGIVGGISIVFAGLFAVGVMASIFSLLQRTVADRFLGRIFGVKDLCCTVALLIAAGTLAFPHSFRLDRWVGTILVSVALLTLGAGVLMFYIRLGRNTLGRVMTFAENLNELLAKAWWRFERVGRPTVPRNGAVIVAANHTCSADPIFLSAAVTYRPLSFLVAQEYAQAPVVRILVRMLDCIPVKRDGRDTAATKQSLRHLREGKAVCIFIEGRIVPPGEEGKPRDGVALMALKTGAPVIPAYISGTRYHSHVIVGLLQRHRARVRFGKPVDLRDFSADDREQVRAATRRIYAAIHALAPADAERPQSSPNDVDPAAEFTAPRLPPE